MNVKNRYKTYRAESQEAVRLLFPDYEVPDKYVLLLDNLVLNYDMLYASVEDIKNNGFEKRSETTGKVIKSHSLQSYTVAQQQITRILSQFETSPMQKAKVERLERGADNSDLTTIEELFK